jgi:hypothetical protein
VRGQVSTPVPQNAPWNHAGMTQNDTKMTPNLWRPFMPTDLDQKDASVLADI